jgi:hypothetical protein
MKRKKKRTHRFLIKALLILCLVLICALLGLGLFANRALCTAVETAGTDALGTHVTVTDADLWLKDHRFVLQDLIVNNPEGYEQTIFLTVQQVNAQVKLNTLLKETVHIDHLELSDMQVFIESKGVTTNLQEVVDAIELGMEEQTYVYAKKLTITQLVMDNIQVEMQLPPLLGKPKPIRFSVAPITLHDLGNDGQLNVGTLTAKIILALVAGVLEQGASMLPGDMQKAVQGPLGETAKKSFELLKDNPEAGEMILEGAKSLGKGIMEILSPNQPTDTPHRE